jgi:membrane-associated phospholipid phosphatase
MLLRLRLIAFVLTASLGIVSPTFAQTQLAAPSAPAGEPNFFTTTLNDFRQLPSKENLTWLAIGGAIALAGHSQDWDVTRSMSESRQLGDVMKPGETIGGARMQLIAAVATYTVGRTTGNAKVAALGSDLVRANIVAQAVTGGIKLAVGRTRPDGTQYSFPSGHTSVTFATATVLQRHFGWKVGAPAYALASYVAASRVQAKRHFLSDVAFGASIGIIAGRTVTIGRGSARFAVSPTVSAGRAGVSFDLVNQR